MARVSAEVTSSFPSQHPQLEGAGQDTELFGRREWAQQSSVDAWVEAGVIRVARAPFTAPPPALEFGVYPPGTKRYPTNAPIRVQLVEVGTASSTARVVAGRGSVTPGSRAVQLSMRYTNSPLRVLIEDAPQAPVLSEVRRQLSQHRQLELTSDAATYDLRLREQVGRRPARSRNSMSSRARHVPAQAP